MTVSLVLAVLRELLLTSEDVRVRVRDISDRVDDEDDGLAPRRSGTSSMGLRPVVRLDDDGVDMLERPLVREVDDSALLVPEKEKAVKESLSRNCRMSASCCV